MKTVFDNRQLAHVWAQQTQASGHSNSMRFEGPTIYSYQTPIARFYEVNRGDAAYPEMNTRVCLVTSETYSTTTSSKHMPAVRRALSDSVRTFSVPHVLVDERARGYKTGMAHAGTHADNLAALHRRYSMEYEAQKRRRTVYGSAYDALEQLARDCRSYARIFALPVPEFNPQDDAATVERYRAEMKAKRETPTYLAAQARKEAAKAKRDEAAALERMTLELERRTEWLAGANNQFYGADEKGGAYLRIVGDEVQTSQGARIPVDDAKRAILFIRSRMGRFHSWLRNGETCQVGAFQIDRIEHNGDIKAGCHFIQFSEIDRIGKLLGV